MFQPNPQGVVIQQQPVNSGVPQMQQTGVPVQQQAPQQMQAPVQQQSTMVYNEQAQGYQAPAPGTVVQQAPVPQAPVQVVSDEQVAAINNAEGQLNQFFTHAGIASAQVEQEFKAFGKLTDGTRKALVDKHGEATANLVSDQMSAVYQQKVQATQQNVSKVHALLQEGFKDMTQQTGAETFAEIDAWAKQNLSVDERTQINKLMNQGGMATELAVSQLITLFKTKNGVQQDAAIMDGATLQPGAATGQDLTITMYNTEMAKLTASGVPYESPQAEALKQRREASRKRGIN